MSDTGRKDFSDRAQEKITPDSSKSTVDKTKESVTNTADHAARELQPDDHKSKTQELGDKTARTKDHHTSNESTLDKIKDKLHLGGNKTHE